MCGIFMSNDIEKFQELAELNLSRGSRSYSITRFDPKVGVLSIHEYNESASGKTRSGQFIMDDGFWKIGHIQSPTNEANPMHPARFFTYRCLWHNGLVKTSDLQRLKEKHNVNSNWDTIFLLFELQSNMAANLSEINGSFSCIYINKTRVFVFRNEISPMFYDASMNFSSVEFPESVDLPPNKIFEVDLINKSLSVFDEFKTKENPYYFL